MSTLQFGYKCTYILVLYQKNKCIKIDVSTPQKHQLFDLQNSASKKLMFFKFICTELEYMSKKRIKPNSL